MKREELESIDSLKDEITRLNLALAAAKEDNFRVRTDYVPPDAYRMVCAERDLAVKCIADVLTYLELGSPQFAEKQILTWKRESGHEGFEWRGVRKGGTNDER